MPRTRVRAKPPLVITISSGTSDGTNPAGSSLTVDSIGAIDIGVNEPSPVPGEVFSFALTVASAELNAAPEDSVSSVSIVTQGTDLISAPTNARSFDVSAGAPTATATNTAGNGWTNPTNAQGVNDGTNAQANSPAGLTPANQAGTLNLTFADIGAVSLETRSSAPVLTIFATLTVGLLATGSLTLSYSTDSGAVYTQIANLSTTNAGPFSVVLPLNVNLANVRVRAATSVTGSATSASTATFDAAVISFSTNSNATG